MFLAVISTSADPQDPFIAPSQPPLETSSPVAGSQLLTWWGDRGDVTQTLLQLGGVQMCSEALNVHVDTEVLDEEMLNSCKRETAGFDMMELLQPSEELMVPTQEQMKDLCRSEACAAWLSLAVKASWLPDCSYRQSQTSIRSLAETLLRVRTDLISTGMDKVAIMAPTASSFRDLYKLNVLANMLTAKEEALHEVSSPVLPITRQMAALDDLNVMGSDDVLQPGATVKRHPMSIGTIGNATNVVGLGHGYSTDDTSASSRSADNFNVVGTSANFRLSDGSNGLGDTMSGVESSSNDSAGFTSSGIGPHASSTTTTTDLTLTYAYVVGAWVLFNGSYYFLMRRK
uniref:Uncharacterized protein n=1 Tax=Hyaloperonospora arabidopsidis (strain Emoy2) TaxID=559515 RepID=M4BGZ6_HYAAE